MDFLDLSTGREKDSKFFFCEQDKLQQVEKSKLKLFYLVPGGSNVEIKRRKITTTSKADKITAKKPKKTDKINTKAKEEEIITVSAPKDWKTEEQSKQEDAKKKAAEVMKKLRETGLSNKKTAGKSSADAFMEKVREIAPSKKQRSGKSNQKKHQLKRQVLNAHNLSESESD